MIFKKSRRVCVCISLGRAFEVRCLAKRGCLIALLAVFFTVVFSNACQKNPCSGSSHIQLSYVFRLECDGRYGGQDDKLSCRNEKCFLSIDRAPRISWSASTLPSLILMFESLSMQPPLRPEGRLFDTSSRFSLANLITRISDCLNGSDDPLTA